MSDEQDGGSSGLMIGLIVVGGVVLVLVLLGVLGFGFFFMLREGPAPVAVAPVAAPVAAPWIQEEAVPPPPLAPPAPGQAVKGRDRLLGVWEGKTLDGDETTLEFLADGTLQSITRPELGERLKAKGRWDVVEEAGDRLKLRRTAADNTDSVQDIRFEGPDRFVIEGKGGAVYTRQAK